MKKYRMTLPGVLGILFFAVSAFSGDSQENAASGTVPKIKISVLDFTTVDIQGQKFYQYQDKDAPDRGKMNILNDADRQTVDDRMLGLVKVVEAWDEASRRAHDRMKTDVENAHNRALRDALGNKLLSGKERSVIIGAEYMIAALGAYDTFLVVDRNNIDRALLEIDLGKTNLADEKPLADFGRIAGVTHLLYATAADMRTKQNSFKGYGIQTDNTVYSLDLVVKLVDIGTRETVFSGVFTGTYKVLQTEHAKKTDDGIFREMMKDAVAQAAAALNEKVSPAKLSASSAETKNLPKVHINPRGLAEPSECEIFVDGIFKGNAPAVLEMMPGRHRIELKASGYDSKAFDLDVTGGENISPKFQKVQNDNGVKK